MKPKHQGGYDSIHTVYCERTLVTLLRGMGPWKSSVYLIGGLVPRYLFAGHTARDELSPSHIGTTDVDIVLNLDVLADTEAYNHLEANLKRMGFERGKNEEGREQNHRWVRAVTEKITVVVDLLCEGDNEGGRPQPLPKATGRLSALKIPGAHLVFNDFIEVPITAELLEEGGVRTEKVRVAGAAAFLILKAIAFDERFEEKDSYDIVYVLSNIDGGPRAAAQIFSEKMSSAADQDKPLFQRALDILFSGFATDPQTQGYRKDGPTAYARFLADPGNPDQDVRNKRAAAAVVELFLSDV